METGVVKWFDPKKGYGFIIGDNGLDVFVHWTHIAGEDLFKTLEQGQRVEFDRVRGKKGFQADNVRPIPA
ncbi:MAG: cold-shock protein [Planctomycetota bacterium]